jgi:GH35 family endo-1,4-beta-xylanase
MATQDTNNLADQGAPTGQAPIARGAQLLQVATENIERYRKGTAQVEFYTPTGEALQGIEVEIVQKTQDFLFGNLIFDLVWGDPPYKPVLFKQRFLELFNFAIFPFYWSSYERTPGMPQGRDFLPILEWCHANGVTPKGHPLVWPYNAGIPEWLYEMPGEAVEALTQARVTNLVKGFAKHIQIWDVTNEAVNHVSWEEATQPAFRTKYHEVSLWRGIEVAGGFKREIPIRQAADWVEKSFNWAYAANPKATLIVNDYNQEIDPAVRQRFYDLIRELQGRGVPVSGLGLQVHPVNYWIWPEQLWETLEMYAELECPLHITELHQPSSGEEIEGGWRQGVWSEVAQAEFIGQLYRQCFGHPAVVSINYWGLSDRNIWIEGAGLADAEYRPKPVFHALKKLIKEQWMTLPIIAYTDQAGQVSFSGFYGEYEVLLQRPGKQFWSQRIHLMQGEANAWTFSLNL